MLKHSMFKFLLCLLVSWNLSAAELKVLSWNTFMLPKFAKNTYQHTRSDLIAQLDVLEQYDVIMFQEMFTGHSYKVVKKHLSKTHPYNTGKPDRVFYKLVNSGLTIFSKYPLSDIKFKKFSSGAASDAFSSKGVLMATATLTHGKKIKLATTHLQAKKGKKYSKIRFKQIRTIKKYLFEKYASDETPLVFGGDFNISHHHPLHKFFWYFMNSHGAEYMTPQGELQYSAEFKTNDVLKRFSDAVNKQKWIDILFLFPKSSNFKMVDFRIHDFQGGYDLFGSGVADYSLSDHHAVETTIQY